jgi:signal transduction histidine kinase
VTDLDTTIRDIRTAIFELRAPAAASLHSELIDTVEASAHALGFRPTLRVSGLIDRGVPDAFRPEIVAVAREALSNVVRHAHAHAVEVSVDVTADAVTLRVTDDGVGIVSPKPGNGLGNMRARAEDRAGHFSLTNVDPHGTRLTWSVPIPAASDGQ